MPTETKQPKIKKTKTIALLVAAGESLRMREDLPDSLPKPYMTVGGETILRRIVKTFIKHPAIDTVRVVIRREHHPYYRKTIEGLNLMPCVFGSNSRQESVCLGLESLAHHHPERVLIHDVARPLVGDALISRIADALENHTAVIPLITAVDTIKRIENGKIVATIARNNLGFSQTPQGFCYKTIMEAHIAARGQNFTDDAAVCEFSKVSVFTVGGEMANFKVTTPADLKRMENEFLINMETRTGMGYDVHTLVTHDVDTPVTKQTIKICGVKIQFTHYLAGHSDADVGLHAIVDAMLGAIAAGDIGMHFPPDDNKWKGADSERFLLYAYELLKNRGGDLVHIDCTIICERPKISKYRQEMISHIANLLKIDETRVSIKGTTTEKLGFTGRSEGIAAHAVATVRIPRTDGR